MSKKSIINTKTRCKDSRMQPAILRRKRKAENEFQIPLSPSSESNGPLNSSSDNLLSDESHFSENDDHQTRSSPSSIAFRIPQCMPTPEGHSCLSPLPNFSWADPTEVWKFMLRKDKSYLRNHHLMSRHPSLHARMRSVLLDWLMEVCEVYTLHRETFYLAQDFIDRYLATQVDVPKQQLQLLGITALFIAAKIEEIYPPKLSEFAYVTDEACAENEILEKELIILKILNWDLTPMTVNGWLNVYLQLETNSPSLLRNSDNFLLPEYCGKTFVKVAQLLDLCILDVSALQFSYRILSASAFYLADGDLSVLPSTGFEFKDIEYCVSWMTPFAQTLKKNGYAELKSFSKIANQEMHTIQTHNVDLQLLEKVYIAKTDMYHKTSRTRRNNQ